LEAWTLLWVPGYRKRLLADRGELGRWGERFCGEFLKKQGYKFLARNYTCKYGEIDLIFINPAVSPPEIVFVEVKTRRREGRFRPQDLVRKKQRRRIGYAAKHFMQQYQIKDKQPRFDIMVIILGRKSAPIVRQYKNAFIP
jgi:putative endonuclease